MIKMQTQNQDKATNLLYLNKSKRITSLIGLIVSMKNLIDMQEEVDPFQVLVSVLISLVIIENNRYFKRMKIILNSQLTKKQIKITNININEIRIYLISNFQA